MKHESDGATNCNWSIPNSHQRIGTGNGGLEKKSMSGDYLNYRIIEVG